MITHEQVEQWLQEEMQKARDIKIPIAEGIDPKIEFPKAQSFYGQCSRADKKHPRYKYYIRVSEYFLASDDENEVRQTLMHELIHTCPGCMNHGPEWKRHVNKVNLKYGYQIARIGEFHHFSLRREAEKRRGKAANSTQKVRYKIVCEGCGVETLRTRRTRATENIDNYHCRLCGGRLRVEEV